MPEQITPHSARPKAPGGFDQATIRLDMPKRPFSSQQVNRRALALPTDASVRPMRKVPVDGV